MRPGAGSGTTRTDLPGSAGRAGVLQAEALIGLPVAPVVGGGGVVVVPRTGDVQAPRRVAVVCRPRQASPHRGLRRDDPLPLVVVIRVLAGLLRERRPVGDVLRGDAELRVTIAEPPHRLAGGEVLDALDEPVLRAPVLWRAHLDDAGALGWVVVFGPVS